MTISAEIQNLFFQATNMLDTVGVWFGALTMLLVFWTWYEVVFGGKRKLRKLHQLAIKKPGELPVILIVNYLPDKKEMKSDVFRYINTDKSLNNIASEHIFEVSPKRSTVLVEDMPAVVSEIREIAQQISHTGTDCIHLFYGGPHVIASIIGKEFANSHRVMLYQQDRETKQYTNFGSLSHHNI